MATFGRYEIQEHDGLAFGRHRWSLDRRERDPDGFDRLVNVGWYTSYDHAKRAMHEHKAKSA